MIWSPIAAAAAAAVFAASTCARTKTPPPKSTENSKTFKYPVSKPSNSKAESTGTSKTMAPLKTRSNDTTTSALFALDFLRAASSDDTNYICSPFSVGAALVLVHCGAKGETQQELGRLLGGTLTPSDLCSLYSSLTADLSQSIESVDGPAVSIRVANGLFVDKEFTLKAVYQSQVQKAFMADVHNLDFKDGETAAQRVNSFVSENTAGMISRLVDSHSFTNAVAILINAIYFKGAWETPFQENKTTAENFHGVTGDREEKFMNSWSLSVPYSLSNGLAVVSLPYQDPAFSLMVMMPSGEFGEWRAKLTAASLHSIVSNLKTGEVNLSLPKFKFESTTDGKNALQKCGVGSMFGLGADLSGISDQNLFVSDVRHNAIIEVNEEGTTAAASTYAAQCLSAFAEPPTITFDSPFLFLVLRDSDIIFCGQMV